MDIYKKQEKPGSLSEVRRTRELMPNCEDSLKVAITSRKAVLQFTSGRGPAALSPDHKWITAQSTDQVGVIRRENTTLN